MKKYQVIVIGGGHSGCEAASAAARIGAETLLITHKKEAIGQMSCNPSIGGIAKGIMVREIDALGGIMARAIDCSGTHFKVLNASKGYAVHGPRAQADRKLYKNAIQKLLQEQKNLDILAGDVEDMIIENNIIKAVILANGSKIACDALIITTGTFLKGIIHIGEKQIPAGRIGEKPAIKLADSLYKAGFLIGRMKTGTPPRIDSKTIDWTDLECQLADNPPLPFSFQNKKIKIEQINCAITYTNKTTHKIIEDNIKKSSIYSGQILSKGPRYCPSIEDKITRFKDKERHQVFLEKEGLDDDTIYPNGLSTALPEEIQEQYIHSIKGLENAKITSYGYAIEYDYINPCELSLSLETKKIQGLFLAGQINGTTGYEEAAGQGIVAGFNAGLKVQNKEAINFTRDNSYIGVLIDDLIRLGTEEPYRMFTSRAEYRLKLRADNADQRLSPLALKLGILSKKQKNIFLAKIKKIEKLELLFEKIKISPNKATEYQIKISKDGRKRNLLVIAKYLDDKKYKEIYYKIINDYLSSCAEIKDDEEFIIEQNLWQEVQHYSDDIWQQVKIHCKYQDYIEMQKKDILAIKKDENIKIPKKKDFFNNIGSLSNEVREKLNKIRPENLAQAGRIQGITPASILAILVEIKK